MNFLKILVLLTLPLSVFTQPAPKYDLYKVPVLYTVGYAHLDTEWRWDYEETVNAYLKSTLDDNFRFFEKYKEYVFTFSGARRYKMMKEYYPDRYERMKNYIRKRRWFVGGSSVDECDANIPSPESVIRQVLYGNSYFKNEFSKESVDFLLPDCFGFQSSLPSVLAHAGLKGFSTQKLGWGSAVGIPFNVGNWIGPDGKGVVAALNGTSYSADIEPRIDTTRYWIDRVMANGKKSGVFADFRYYGTGDVGGAPSERAIVNGIRSMNNDDSKFQVYFSSSDQLFRDLTQEQKSALPEYTGDLLLTQHSAGSLTSEAYMKRWNRKNELLAQSAEPLAVAADWLGGISYPKQKFNDAWWLVLGSQMHDILPGTCIPKAYEYAWNDEVLGLNLFAGLLESAAGVVTKAMDTRVKGTAVVVYNPIAIAREDLVEAEVNFPEGTPGNLAVFGPDWKEVPSQVLSRTKNSAKILFMARVPSFGLACFDVRPVEKTSFFNTSLGSGPNFIENEYYKVVINPQGDISSIIDKKQNKEILSAPARLEFRKEHPRHWPAWNMDWSDRNKPPDGFVDGPAKISFVENGPVRVSLRIERSARNSGFLQFIRLTTGEAGKRIEIKNTVEWQSKGVSLKASFPLMASNPVATYNLGLGTIERTTNNEKKYEVPSREWFDLSDKSGKFGVTIVEDCKFGSDKPDDKTLRLTLLYTPATNFYHDQATQDWGTHDFTYGIYSHTGDWRTGQSEWQGRKLNQPLVAFQTSSHAGTLGSSFSLLRVSTPAVDVRAVKKAESSNQIVIRLQELFGKDADTVKIAFAGKIIAAKEIDGQEHITGEAKIAAGKLVVDMKKYALRSFTLTLESPAEKLPEPECTVIPLLYDQDVVSTDVNKRSGTFEPGGYGIPAELFPDSLKADGIEFRLGSGDEGRFNAIACKGQKILLPKNISYNRIYFLAAAVKDTQAVFRIGSGKSTLRIQSYHGKIGQFDNRKWDKYDRIRGLDKGFIKRNEVAWFATHLHKDTLNIPYQYAYLFKYVLTADPETGYIQLPDNPSIKIFALTVAQNDFDVATPVQPLYDDFSSRKTLTLAIEKHFVTENLTPTVKVTTDDNSDQNKLPYRVSMKDYADMHMPAGATMKYYYSGTGIMEGYQPAQGISVNALVDGMFDLLPSDTTKDIWFEKGEGRLVMDLQEPLEIDSLHLFAQMSLKRGGQIFSLWGSDKSVMPVVTGDPKTAGWQFMVYVPALDVWGNNKAVYSVVTEKGKPLKYRYLMWLSEETPHGPFYFREVDVFEKQK